MQALKEQKESKEIYSADNFLNLSSSSYDLLKILNDQDFFSQHLKVKYPSFSKIHSVIILRKGGETPISLHQRNPVSGEFVKVTSETLSPKSGAYVQLKEISHISLLIYNLIHNPSLSDAAKKLKFSRILSNIETIHDDLKPVSTVLSVQKYILERSMLLLSELIDSPKESYMVKFEKYLSDLKPFLRYNNDIAAETQLTSLDDTISSWRKTKKLDLLTARVIVVSTHGARPELLESQYFSLMYKKLGILAPVNNMMHQLEVLPDAIISVDDQVLIDTLGVFEHDKGIGSAYSNDPGLMFKDILAESAKEGLKKLPKFSGGLDKFGLCNQKNRPLKCPFATDASVATKITSSL